MTQKNNQNGAEDSVEALKALLRKKNGPSISILSTLLDAHLLYEETELSTEGFQTLFEIWWPDTSVDQTITDLRQSGLLATTHHNGFAIPHESRQRLAAQLWSSLSKRTIKLAGGTNGYEDLLGDFLRYTLEERQDMTEVKGESKAWGGKTYNYGGQTHQILFRPHLLRLQPHPEMYILVLSRLPQTGIETITDKFVRSRALQQRLAIYDLERAEKLNLTKSGVFVFFERYLRRVHGLRMGHSQAFSKNLEDKGILSLRMG